MKTILITGTSSGYGLETARHFHEQGWRVVATMRNPRPAALPASDRLTVVPLDVTDAGSIAACVAAAGPIDVLVNNAGIGMGGAFEATPMEHIRKAFETNTFGTMAMTQAVFPGMREWGGGVVVNVTSSTTLAPHPYFTVYTASKTAIEGLAEALAAELDPFGIRVKLVIPGHAPTTRFAENTTVPVLDLIPEAYASHAQAVFEDLARPGPKTRESDLAEAIWQAVNDTSARLRFPAGADAAALRDARH